ncbi:hypothetical protein D3C78_17920 [compost metagenome]
MDQESLFQIDDQEQILNQESLLTNIDNPLFLRQYISQMNLNPSSISQLEEIIAGRFPKKSEATVLAGILIDRWEECGEPIDDIKRRSLLKEITARILEKRGSVSKGKKSNIIEKNGKYVQVEQDANGNNITTDLTEFILQNLRKTVSVRGSHLLIADIVYQGVITHDVVFTGRALTDVRRFRELVKDKSRADTAELTGKQLSDLVKYIESLPYKETSALPYLGYHYVDGIPFFAYIRKEMFGHSERQVLTYATADEVDMQHGIYYEDTLEAETKFQYLDCPHDEWQELAKTILTHFPQSNNFNKMSMMVSWFLATPARHIPDLGEIDARFPILHIAGTPGSGKTTLVSFLAKMMGYVSTGGTFAKNFVNVKNLAESNAHFYWIDEFKVDGRSSEEDARRLFNMLRKNYDSGIEERGRADQGRNMYKLVSPVVMSGESEISDAATMERTVQICMSKEETESKYKSNKSYEILTNLKRVNRFALQYHKWFLSNHEHWYEWYALAEQLAKKAGNKSLSSRIFKKGIWIAFGLIIARNLAEEVQVDSYYTDDVIVKILMELYADSSENSARESIDYSFMQFLADTWRTGLYERFHNNSPGVILKNDRLYFATTPWVARFRDYCMKSDQGAQTSNAIMRYLKEIASKGCIEFSSTVIRFNKGVARGFRIIPAQIEKVYGINEDFWHYEPDDEFILNPEEPPK